MRKIFNLAVHTSTNTEENLVAALLAQALERCPSGANEASHEKLRFLTTDLLQDRRKHIAFINDNGFYAGAGIATSRQAQSLLQAGHKVSVVALNPDESTLRCANRITNWLQSQSHQLSFYSTDTEEKIITRGNEFCHKNLITRLHLAQPIDLVVVGNLHSDQISWSFIEFLLNLEIPIALYGHDCDLITGGCAYPQYHDCFYYRTGCADDICMKPENAYPQSSNGRIKKNYLIRSALSVQENVAFLANSHWTENKLEERFDKARIDVAHLGVDTDQFCPSPDRGESKKALGLDPSKIVISIGADSLSRTGKGGAVVNSIIKGFKTSETVTFLCFGHAELQQENLVKTGYLESDQEMAKVFQASDLYLNPVNIEAFGQTFLEASACGCVPIGLAGSGAGDVVDDGISGFLCENEAIIKLRIEELVEKGELRAAMSKMARELAVHRFSLGHQYVNLIKSLTRLTVTKGATQKDPLPGNQPLLSILTTTKNCCKDLKVTIASLQMQSFRNFEWVVQDGVSNDGTIEAIQASKQAALLESEPDLGIYDAMNKAVHRANGKWILFLQAGDWLAGCDALENLVASCEFNRDIIVAPTIEVSIEGTKQKRSPINPSIKLAQLKDDSYLSGEEHWLHEMPCHQGIVMRRPWLERIPFDTTFRISADWHQMLQAINNGATVEMTDQVLSWYPNGGYSFDNSDEWILDAIRIVETFAATPIRASHYFEEALIHHKTLKKERMLRKSIIAGSSPESMGGNK